MAEAVAGTRVDRTEKRVIWIAILFIAASLGLIAYATWGLGISVPTCVPASKAFERGSVAKLGEKHYEIHFLAEMWTFEPKRVLVPAGSTLEIYVTSKDVTHGFQIQDTNVNLMAEPGVVTNAQVRITKPGVYPIICHEYCGVAHENMNAVLEVSRGAADISAEGLPSTEAGRKVMEAKGCLACHSLDGSPGVGPSFKGVWGQKVELADGTTRVVDAAFVTEKILHPEQNTVKGFSPVMPKLPLTKEEIDEIENFLEDMK